MTSQKIAISLVAVALFVGSMTAHAADFDVGKKAYLRRDYATALRIFRQLAAQGNASSQTMMGAMYSEGLGVPQDYGEALKWYRKAADQGYALAQYNLGFMYRMGQGVEQDYTLALRWYRMAADQGYAQAQFNLGVMYVKGQGVTQNYVQAYLWFTIAATQGQTDVGKWRDLLAKKMTPAQISEAQRLAREWKPKRK